MVWSLAFDKANAITWASLFLVTDEGGNSDKTEALATRSDSSIRKKHGGEWWCSTAGRRVDNGDRLLLWERDKKFYCILQVTGV